MIFEFDAAKSEANRKKHGIDFDEAQKLWDDVNRLEVPAFALDEPRNLVIGVIDGKHWSAIVTYRNGRTRLISARRARKKEMERYESAGHENQNH